METRYNKYSCVIPVYNESENIELLYKRLKLVMDNLHEPYELIFVDDGSADSSYCILREIALADTTVKVLSFTKNFGHHNAVIAGLANATGDYIITMDADLQNPPEEITKLTDKIKQGFDMVSGVRSLRKDSNMRRFCSYIANLTIAIKTGVRMKDYGSMLRIFKQEVADNLIEEFKKSGGYITMLMAKVADNITEIEVEHSQRHSGESKYGVGKLLSAFVRVLSSSGRKPMLYTIGKRVEYGKEKTITP